MTKTLSRIVERLAGFRVRKAAPDRTPPSRPVALESVNTQTQPVPPATREPEPPLSLADRLESLAWRFLPAKNPPAAAGLCLGIVLASSVPYCAYLHVVAHAKLSTLACVAGTALSYVTFLISVRGFYRYIERPRRGGDTLVFYTMGCVVLSYFMFGMPLAMRLLSLLLDTDMPERPLISL